MRVVTVAVCGWVASFCTGQAQTDPASNCAPRISSMSWTSPYAGWSRGIPSDKSFFPIAVWLQGARHIPKLARLGVNIMVGNSEEVNPLRKPALNTLEQLGMYAIVAQDSLGLSNADSAAIVGWIGQDEPDNSQSLSGPMAPSQVLADYKQMKSADPSRPVMLNLGQGVANDKWHGRGWNPPPESEYVVSGDIVSFDVYPYASCGGDWRNRQICGEFWLSSLGVTRLRQWSKRGQAVWATVETTNFRKSDSIEVTPSRIASEVWLALIHGANGIMYFIHTWNPAFREDGIFADEKTVAAVTALNKQIKALAPILNSADVPGALSVSQTGSNAPVDAMAKIDGSKLYIFSAVSRAGVSTTTFMINGMTGDGAVDVLGENRTIDVKAGRFVDTFEENAFHIYALDLAAVRCN